MKLFRLVLRNLRRNPLRTFLTTLPLASLAAIFSMVIAVLSCLDRAMQDRSRQVRLVITQRHRIPSRFDLDPEMRDKSQQFLAIATIPEKLPLLTAGLEEFDPQRNLCQLMKMPPQSHLPHTGMFMGRLAKLNKKIGDVFKVKSTSHRGAKGERKPLELELEIVGELPREGKKKTAGKNDSRSRGGLPERLVTRH